MYQSIPKSKLGRTSLEVTRLGYGTGGKFVRSSALGNQKLWQLLLNQVLDSGINYIDTSNDYGVRLLPIELRCPSEEMIGKYISHRRSEYYLATKSGCTPDGPHVWTRENVFRGLHESLKRMRTDYVDVMQYHLPSPQDVEIGNLVEALQDMRMQGKVRWIGVSTSLPDLATFLEWDVFDVFQLPYSALDREHEDWITKASNSGAGIVIRGGVAQGERSRDNASSKEISDIGLGLSSISWDKYYEAELDDLRDNSETRTTFLMRYTLRHPHAHTNIVGTSKIHHLNENIAGIKKGPLSADVYDEVQRRLNILGVTPDPIDRKILSDS